MFCPKTQLVTSFESVNIVNETIELYNVIEQSDYDGTQKISFHIFIFAYLLFKTNFPSQLALVLHFLRTKLHGCGCNRKTVVSRISAVKFRVSAREASFERVACPGLLSRRRLLLVKIALSTWSSRNLANAFSATTYRSRLILLVENR